MRSRPICAVLIFALGFMGCGGGDSAPPMAANSGGAAPGPPGGPPSGPPMDTPPAEGAPPSDGQPSQPSDNPEGLATGTPDGTPSDGYVPPTPEGTPGESPLVGPDGAPIDPSQLPQRPKTFQDILDDTLLAGNEKEWLRLTYTNYVGNPYSWKELQQQMTWVPGMRRASLGTRMGIAVLYVNAAELPRDFKGSPQPIGSAELAQAMATFGQSSAENSGGGEDKPRRKIGERREAEAQPASEPAPEAGGESGARGQPREQLTYYTGDVGDKFLKALAAKIASGDYGLLYKDAAELLADSAPGQADPNNPNPDGSTGQPSDGAPPSDGAEGGAGRAAASGERLGLGIAWLGKANSRGEIEQAANKAGVDLIITFDLVLRPAKNNTFVNNVTKIRITSARKKEEPVFTSAPLENRVVIQAREKEKKEDAADAVDKEVKKAMDALDQKCKTGPLPSGISADAVKGHLRALITEKPADPLPVLAEARYYALKGLLSEDDMNKAAAALIGETEYARLIAKSPGLGKALGSTLNLPAVASFFAKSKSAASGRPPLAANAAGSAPPDSAGGQPPPRRRGKGKNRPPM